MLERLQSALKTVKESKPASLFPHRFVTIRRGSPAAKSGQIRAGDRLEAVEGRPVGTVPHRELSQILRRAGNTLRLTIVPRPSTYSSNLTETAEHDHGHRGRKGQRSRPKRDSRYYSVDLDRGPSGFGFSLRGGSEYNMGLYVLGLMKGGPASRSKKIQVSDQLVEINGDSTAGMTHSQAVEMIRRGGQRIHLVLKRGNGYVPDYALEHRLTSPSLLYNPRKQSVATVTSTIRRGPSSMQKRRSRSQGDERGTGTRTRRMRRRSSVGECSVLQNPISERRARSREDRGTRRKIRSQSLPRDVTRTYEDDEEEEAGTARGRRGYEERGRSRNAERSSRSRKSEVTVKSEEFKEEEKQRARAVEERVDRRLEERRGRVLFEESEDDAFLLIPNQTRKLPRPNENWEAESEEDWGVARRYRELKREKEREDFQSDSTLLHDDDDDEEDENHNARSVSFENPLPGAALTDPASHRKSFSFLTSSLSVEQLGDTESESEGSQSGSSLSAATVSGLSAARRVRPGPWLTPTQQRLALEERRWGRRSTVS